MKPQYIMLGGRSCSGKSYFTKPESVGGMGLVDADSFIILDIGSIKEQLPEYSTANVCMVHRESCEIFEQISEMARSKQLDIAHELTMSNLAQTLTRAKGFADAGYEIRAYYMFVPPQEAAKRALKRFQGEDSDFSGIFVPPEAILTTQQNNEVTFEILKEFVGEWRFYDNQGAKPELLGSGVNNGSFSIAEDGSTILLMTEKGTTKIKPDGTVITSSGTIIDLASEEPFRDNENEVMCYANGDPILLSHFINDPGSEYMGIFDNLSEEEKSTILQQPDQ